MSRQIKSATDLERLFAQVLNKPVKEVTGLFEFLEEEGWIIAVQFRKIYLEPKEWMPVFRAAYDLGGKAEKTETGQWEFRFPKTARPKETPEPPEAEAPETPEPTLIYLQGEVSRASAAPKVLTRDKTSSPLGPADAEKPMPEEEYDLKASASIGYLYPVLLAADGDVIDGRHRKAVDPDWPTQRLEHIIDPVQKAIARLVANYCRRQVPAEEKTEWLREIAESTGWTPKQIAEALRPIGIGERWVYKYLPGEFKAAEPEELARARRAREVEKPTVPCATCGQPVAEPVHIQGKFYCHSCAEKASEPKPPILGGGWVYCSSCGIMTKGEPDAEGKVYCSKCRAERQPPTESPAEKRTAEQPEAPSETAQVPSDLQEKPPEAPPETPAPKPEEIDTLDTWICPICKQGFKLIHSEKKHKIEPIEITEIGARKDG